MLGKRVWFDQPVISSIAICPAMDHLELLRELHQKNDSKIVMLVADGLGGLPLEPGGKTELETANTPQLDALAKRAFSAAAFRSSRASPRAAVPATSGCSAMTRCSSSLVAVRSKRPALVSSSGRTTSRFAPTFARSTPRATSPIAARAASAVRKVLRWRFVCGRSRFRASRCLSNRSKSIALSSCCVVGARWPCRRYRSATHGRSPLQPQATKPDSEKTAQVAAEFVKQANVLLKDEKKANGMTLRGFSAKPNLPSYEQVYGLKAAAIAVYPMYKGLARLVGMEIVGKAQTLAEQIDVLEQNWAKYDFFFIHFKYTDSTGEDGNFAAKVQRIEELDGVMSRITKLQPTVLIVTGDHSTPSFLKSHSWHPVPTLLVSDCCRSDESQAFGERDCVRGGLGQFEAKYLMTLAMANAGRLGKFGA